MKLHLFNPSHDEALAAHSPYYYPSGAARKLATEWAMLPALWAEAGDAVWIPDDAEVPHWDDAELPHWKDAELPNSEETESHSLGKELKWLYTRKLTPNVWKEVEEIVPWGWDLLLRHQLLRAGAPERLLPDEEIINTLRTLSSRQTTTEVLPLLREALTDFPLPLVGESQLIGSEEEVEELLKRYEAGMIKALWSCSGRGVFRVTGELSASERGRIKKLIREQGAVEWQPAYERETDFALEFVADANGAVRCVGFSHFATHPTGQYAGNLVAPAEELEARTAALLGSTEAVEQLCETASAVFTQYMAGRYTGPFGMDLMTVRTEEGTALMPCVEVNLRRTMGHTALHLSQKIVEHQVKEEDIPTGLRKLWYFCPR